MYDARILCSASLAAGSAPLQQLRTVQHTYVLQPQCSHSAARQQDQSRARVGTGRRQRGAASHAGRIVSIGDGVLGDGMMLEYCADATRTQQGPPGGGATRSELASIFLG